MNIILYEILISLSTGLMYFLTAAGMSIVVSGMNVINFGQGQFYMLGTLICFSLWKLTGSFALSVIAAMLIVGLCGGFITEHLLRPLYGKPMLYQLLLTMGIGYVIQDMFVMFWGSNIVTMKAPSYLNFRVKMLGMKFPAYYLFLIAVSFVICIIMLFVFKKTKIGMTFRAIITNRDMVSCMGVNVKKLNTCFLQMFGFFVCVLRAAMCRYLPPRYILHDSAGHPPARCTPPGGRRSPHPGKHRAAPAAPAAVPA
mgnify:CR=1 FL=1